MNYKDLLHKAQSEFDKNKLEIEKFTLFNVFQKGGEWMEERAQILVLPERLETNKQINYNVFGWLKYGICMLISVISILIFLKLNPVLLPFSILIFYVVEVHFLFLFPNLVYQRKNPIIQSIKQMYSIGLVKSVYIVMRLGLFMMIGLLNFNNPKKNWHLGCLSVLIWYQFEIKKRK